MFLKKIALASLFSFLGTAAAFFLEFVILGPWPKAGFHSWQFAVGFGCFWLIGLPVFYGMLSEVYAKTWTLSKISKNIFKGLVFGIPVTIVIWALMVTASFRELGHWDLIISPFILYVPYLLSSWALSVRFGQRTNRLSEKPPLP